MVKKTYGKLIRRAVKSTRARFFSILSIVTLGCGFLGGLLATTPDMQRTADTYYDNNSFFDIQIKGTLGLSDKDVEALCGLDNVTNAMPSYVTDLVLQDDEGGFVARIYGTDLEKYGTDDYINGFELLEGRLPENENECLIASPDGYTSDHKVGEVYMISDENKNPDTINDTYNFNTLTAVGMVRTPYYMSIESEPSTVGTGRVTLVIFVPEESYSLEAYTDIYLTVRGSKALNSFSDQYTDLVQSVEDPLKDFGVSQCEIRYNDVVFEANQKIDDAQAEYDDAQAEADQKLADARQKLDDGQTELDEAKLKLADAQQDVDDGEKKLTDAQKTLKTTIADKEKELDEELDKAIAEELQNAYDQIDAERIDAERQFQAQSNEIKSGLRQIEITRSDLAAQKQQLLAMQQQIDYADAHGIPVDPTQRAAVAQGLAQAEAGLQELDLKEKELNQAENDLTSALYDFEIEIKNAKTQAYDEIMNARSEKHGETMQEIEQARVDAQSKINDKRLELENAKQKLTDGYADIETAEKKLADGEKEYADAKAEADEKLSDAADKLADARQKVAEIEYPEWYILDREDTVSFNSFKSNSEKIAAIAKVFPIFFFLVAALVALTTMTRMVEEERTQIGTLKALGYSNGSIIAYYIGYSVLATLIGSVIGMIVGFKLFPTLIINAYRMMYSLPDTVTAFYWDYSLIIISTAVICTTAATLAACLDQLSEKPSTLMLPRAPKAGKRVFLEYISFIWNRMKFIQKVTARNILRYKKRFWMTVIGIAGCCALLVTGFGLRDSIHAIVEKQFGEIYKFNLSLYLKNDGDAENDPIISGFLTDTDNVNGYAVLHNENGTAEVGGNSEKVSIYVPKNTDELKQQFTLRVRKTGEDVSFSENSIVLTEKLCEKLGLSVGDIFTLKNSDGKPYDFTVSGICENYITNFVFIPSSAYAEAFGENPEYTLVLADVKDDSEPSRTSISERILKSDNILLVQFSQTIRESFENTVKSIDYIVAVLIISAGLLAVIVVYNLTNINICERRKELATIKVLGFYDREVASYIYRETNILCLIGILFGFGFGAWLHSFVVRTAEVDAVMFGRTATPRSYLFAAALTILFTALVDLIMLGKLRAINMVESMKANE
ncbi:MAG TPA: ABC transporter permease [Oscillospiraceae bacterium]|nr:ABC transporter permease [Oscillospiraceae bacterium]HPF56425.1 ABC transporter permease [Clostridiales bacterium]HPK36316.1 ABC transporter permease [Oscillospiraceae bacterium]HPR76088.1 ABC transporter permease [Oscillospiraceae bacterium]